MKNLLIKILKDLYLFDFFKILYLRLNLLVRSALLIDKLIFENYLKKSEIRKLHIGCGYHILDGWLNSDFFPKISNVLHLDATKKFRFGSDTFDYIFTEHMIEHIKYEDARFMLSECHRILKVNGKIRISTPNLKFLIDLYPVNKSDTQIEYINWSINSFLNKAPHNKNIFVINNFFRDWGHQFIYDEDSLSNLLISVGFTNLKICALKTSNESHLCNLENILRMPESFLNLETITLEATKS